jgi:KDO2-lipid IV(A) lauroyltransferase
MIEYLIYRLLSWLANALPRSVANWISLRIADTRYFFRKDLAAAVRANLKVILPEASEAHRHYTLRWTFRSFGKTICEFVGNRRFNARFIDRCVSFRGLEHIAAARAAGHGAVLTSAHLGNWELGAAAMGFRGIPVLSILQPHPNPRVHRFFMSRRESRHYRVVTVGSAALPILRHLHNNGLVAVLGERLYGEEGLEVEFFGRPVRFPSGPARLALSADAPLIPGFILRRFDDSFMVAFEPPVAVPAAGTREEKILAMTQGFARVVEALVRENASQWCTFYSVFEGARPDDWRGPQSGS